MVSAPSRGPVTNRVIAELKTEGFPVGDNGAPEDAYGWDGEPNSESSSFIPWMATNAMTAQPQRQSSVGDTGREWIMPYAVFYSGITRNQCEALADRMRNALTNISRESIETPTGNWKIQKISCDTIGGTNRVGSAYPDYYTQTDVFNVWLSKEK